MKVYLEPAEILLMEKVATNLRDKLLVHMLFHVGCRISEALSIGVEDVDFMQNNVTILHLKLRVKLSCPVCGTRLGAAHSFCPGCGKKAENKQSQNLEKRRQRVLPIDANTLKLLNEFMEKDGPAKKDGKLLLFGINRHRAWQIVKGCAEKAGLPKLINPETGKIHNVSPHKLRDSFAVNAVKHDDSGDGLRLLQEHLGHQSFNTTARYRKVAGEEHKAWYSKLWKSQE
jgi:integrase/recombinase XerD